MEARATLSEYNQNGWDRVSSSPELVEIFIRDRNNQELSESEEMRISAFWMGYLLRLEFQFLHSPDQFSRTQALKRIQAAYPSFRRTWNGSTSGARSAGKDSFDPEFVRFIDNLVDAGP